MSKTYPINESIDLPEPTQNFDDESNDNFRLHSRIEIIYILREIMQSESLVTLYFGKENSFILTSILGVDSDNDRIIIDCGVDEKTNQRALNHENLLLVTRQNKIKIEFVCTEIKKIQFEGRDAFSVNIPDSLLRIQRRDNFRISTPLAKPIKCVIPIMMENRATNAEVTLLDISCGGIGAIDKQNTLHLEPGSVYINCQIALPEIGVLSTTIKVKNTNEIKSQTGNVYQRVGCEFIDLPPKTEALIQRYIIKQEQVSKLTKAN
ncbi:MAG: flagellar brake protein [Nitrosomonas sp.]|nr:flagellar brake protein [Nitrosomonas sp.]